MNKTELIEHIAKNADLSKAAAGRALEAAFLAMCSISSVLFTVGSFDGWG